MSVRFRTVVLPLLLAAVAPHLCFSTVARQLDGKMLSAWFALRGPEPVPKSVTIVKIDPRSLRKFDRRATQPFGRDELALAIEEIAAAKPKLIILDLYFARADALPESDESLKHALALAPTVIARGIVSHVDTDVAGTPHLELERTIPPAVYVENAAATVPMMVDLDANGAVSAISLGASEIAVPLDLHPLIAPLRKYVAEHIEAPNFTDLINYYGPPSAVPSVPIYKLLAPGESVGDDFFRDRVVFVGGVGLPNSNPNGGDDSFQTPASRHRMYGVEIHASVAQNLLDNSWIKRFTPETEALVQTIVLGIFGLVLMEVGLFYGVLVTAALSIGWALTSYLAFAYFRVFVPGAFAFAVLIPVLLAGFAVTSAMAAWNPRGMDQSKRSR